MSRLTLVPKWNKDKENIFLVFKNGEDNKDTSMNLMNLLNDMGKRITELENPLWEVVCSLDEKHYTDKEFRDKTKRLCSDLFRPT
jgi:hypothetical protein